MTTIAIRRIAAALGLGLFSLVSAAAAGATSESQDDPDRAVRRAMGLLRAGEAREAARGLERYVESDETSAGAWFALGECRRDLLDYGGAVEAMRRARELEPASAEYALALGNLHFVRLEKDRALEQYAAVLDVDPANPHALENRGTILRERDRLFAVGARRRALLLALLAEAAAITAGVLLVCKPGREVAPGHSAARRI